MTMTSKQIADQYPTKGSMPRDTAIQMYALRDAEIVALEKKGAISIQDVYALERTGRCIVANTLWDKCDALAQDALLKDEHHFVRSCADASQRSFSTGMQLLAMQG